jgi:hypothetical protein
VEHPLTAIDVPPGGGPACRQPDEHPDQELHRQMTLRFSRLDEQQRLSAAAAMQALKLEPHMLSTPTWNLLPESFPPGQSKQRDRDGLTEPAV